MDVNLKRTMLKVLLDGKIIYQNGEYQTLKFTPAIELLFNVDKGLKGKEKGQISKSAPIPSKAPPSGLEPETL